MLTPVERSRDAVRMIDQRELPLVETWLDLDSPDRLRFGLLLSELFFTFQSVYLRAMGISDPQPWLWVSQSLPQFLRQPAIRDWWDSTKWEYVAEFAAEVDKRLQATSETDNRKPQQSGLEDSDVA